MVPPKPRRSPAVEPSEYPTLLEARPELTAILRRYQRSVAEYRVSTSASSGGTGAGGLRFVVRFVNILDPLLPGNNLGRTITRSGAARMRRAFARGAAQLEAIAARCGVPRAGDPGVHSGAASTAEAAARRAALGWEETDHFFASAWAAAARHGVQQPPDAGGGESSQQSSRQGSDASDGSSSGSLTAVLNCGKDEPVSALGGLQAACEPAGAPAAATAGGSAPSVVQSPNAGLPASEHADAATHEDTRSSMALHQGPTEAQRSATTCVPAPGAFERDAAVRAACGALGLPPGEAGDPRVAAAMGMLPTVLHLQRQQAEAGRHGGGAAAAAAAGSRQGVPLPAAPAWAACSSDANEAPLLPCTPANSGQPPQAGDHQVVSAAAAAATAYVLAAQQRDAAQQPARLAQQLVPQAHPSRGSECHPSGGGGARAVIDAGHLAREAGPGSWVSVPRAAGARAASDGAVTLAQQPLSGADASALPHSSISWDGSSYGGASDAAAHAECRGEQQQHRAAASTWRPQYAPQAQVQPQVQSWQQAQQAEQQRRQQMAAASPWSSQASQQTTPEWLEAVCTAAQQALSNAPPGAAPAPVIQLGSKLPAQLPQGVGSYMPSGQQGSRGRVTLVQPSLAACWQPDSAPTSSSCAGAGASLALDRSGTPGQQSTLSLQLQAQLTQHAATLQAAQLELVCQQQAQQQQFQLQHTTLAAQQQAQPLGAHWRQPPGPTLLTPSAAAALAAACAATCGSGGMPPFPGAAPGAHLPPISFAAAPNNTGADSGKPNTGLQELALPGPQPLYQFAAGLQLAATDTAQQAAELPQPASQPMQQSCGQFPQPPPPAGPSPQRRRQATQDHQLDLRALNPQLPPPPFSEAAPPPPLQPNGATAPAPEGAVPAGPHADALQLCAAAFRPRDPSAAMLFDALVPRLLAQQGQLDLLQHWLQQALPAGAGGLPAGLGSHVQHGGARGQQAALGNTVAGGAGDSPFSGVVASASGCAAAITQASGGFAGVSRAANPWQQQQQPPPPPPPGRWQRGPFASTPQHPGSDDASWPLPGAAGCAPNGGRAPNGGHQAERPGRGDARSYTTSRAPSCAGSSRPGSSGGWSAGSAQYDRWYGAGGAHVQSAGAAGPPPYAGARSRFAGTAPGAGLPGPGSPGTWRLSNMRSSGSGTAAASASSQPPPGWHRGAPDVRSWQEGGAAQQRGLGAQPGRAAAGSDAHVHQQVSRKPQARWAGATAVVSLADVAARAGSWRRGDACAGQDAAPVGGAPGSEAPSLVGAQGGSRGGRSPGNSSAAGACAASIATPQLAGASGGRGPGTTPSTGSGGRVRCLAVGGGRMFDIALHRAVGSGPSRGPACVSPGSAGSRPTGVGPAGAPESARACAPPGRLSAAFASVAGAATAQASGQGGGSPEAVARAARQGGGSGPRDDGADAGRAPPPQLHDDSAFPSLTRASSPGSSGPSPGRALPSGASSASGASLEGARSFAGALAAPPAARPSHRKGGGGWGREQAGDGGGWRRHKQPPAQGQEDGGQSAQHAGGARGGGGLQAVRGRGAPQGRGAPW